MLGSHLGARERCAGVLGSHLGARDPCAGVLGSHLGARNACADVLEATLAFEKAVQKNCLGFNMTLHHFTLVTSVREWIFSGSH